MNITLLASIVGVIIGFCKLMDWLLSKDELDAQRESLVKWWFALDSFNFQQTLRSSNTAIINLFHRIYGQSHFTLRCFGVSVIASLAAISVCYAVFYIYYGSGADLGDDYNVFEAIVYWILVNLIIDYLSLVETRYCMSRTENAPMMGLFAILVMDVILSFIIYLVGIAIGTYIQTLMYPEMGPVQLSETLQNEIDILLQRPGSPEVSGKSWYGIFGWSTFFTSITLYLYVFSALFFKVTQLFRTRLMILIGNLEESDKLFTAIGTVVAALVACCAAIRGLLSST